MRVMTARAHTWRSLTHARQLCAGRNKKSCRNDAFGHYRFSWGLSHAQAKDALATVEGRLSGTLLGVLSQPSLPLSAEGQAARLITEAVDKENLGRMYIWWMPWM